MKSHYLNCSSSSADSVIWKYIYVCIVTENTSSSSASNLISAQNFTLTSATSPRLLCSTSVTLPTTSLTASSLLVLSLFCVQYCEASSSSPERHYVKPMFYMLQVYDGHSSTAPQLAHLCGSQIPSPISSSKNQLYVKLRTDSSVSMGGFLASYSTSCGGPITAPSGEIHSPSYPGSYPNNVDCSWVISVDPNHRVLLNFSDLDIEFHSNCTWDYVEGNSTGLLVGRFCGDSLPSNYTSVVGHVLWVKFVSDGAVSGAGFRATFSHCNHNSIHPSIFFRLSGPGRGGKSLSRDSQTSLTPDTSSSSSSGTPSLLLVGHAQNTSLGRRPGGILSRCPSHLNWFLSTCRSSGSTPSSSCVTELLTLSLRVRPATLRRKPISAACIRDLVLSVITQSS
uniref:CUB domain-containing protein n=1 Tax=Periophthalmus magnuspinnatus TaxID=409849 RepID=A0A3B4B214_9GOBI